MARAGVTLAFVVASTVIGIMGTDLVLPAIPHLPEALGGSVTAAQLVLAAYVGGACIGLIAYGALSERIATGRLFAGSLVATSLLSLACASATSIEALIGLRALQGMVAAGPAVFAPALIRAMLDEPRAIRAMGLLGSIESLAPALAPVAGAALLALGGWTMSFHVLAAWAAALALLMLPLGQLPQVSQQARSSYLTLLRNRVFLRYATSQAFVLSGLLTFVFGMPTVFVRVLGGTLADFVLMQVTAVLTFIVASNLSAWTVARFGPERVITFGTALAALGAGAQLAYATVGGNATGVITALFVPVNVGLGLRGPPGFYRAVIASEGDDARGSALVVLGILGATALGTALAALWIEQGSVPLAGIALTLHAAALVSLAALPKLSGTA